VSTLSFLAGLALIGWLFLVFARGFFWRADQRLGQHDLPTGESWPPVAVVIPARNERPTIGHAVTAALGQDYPGELNVVVIDDHSDDGTGDEVMRAAAGSQNVHLVHAGRLPQGWTGKLWAQQNGISYVAQYLPETDYLLLTDADIVHPPVRMRGLIGKARSEGRALVSLMVALSCERPVERLLVPAFIFFFQKLYPFPWVNDPIRSEAAAAGGCILVDLKSLRESGGLEAIRGNLIDDCALAGQVKGVAPIWLGLSTQSRSLRRYDTLSEFWTMVVRTAFTQLKYSWALVALTVLSMSLLYVVPPVILVGGLMVGAWGAASLAAAAMALMLVAYAPTLHLYERSWTWGFTLPVAAVLYAAMTVDSARRHWLGKGGEWKGRTFAPTAPMSDQD
jgi:hopene-associated glycosyltransferase HpnB